MIDNIITVVIPTIISGLCGWLFGRRQNNANAALVELLNFDGAIDAYKKLYELREELYKETVNQLKELIKELNDEIKDLRKLVVTLANFITAYMIKSDTINKVDIQDIQKIVMEDK